jgi:hypothetical protein
VHTASPRERREEEVTVSTIARPRPRYEIAHLDDVPHTESDDSFGFQLVGEWRQIRHYFGIKEFSANAFIATEPEQEIVHEHFEQPNDDSSNVGDEELYYVATGHAVVTADGIEHDAPSGTFMFFGEPAVVRKVVARTAGTTILTFGTNPGVEFAVSEFERLMSPPPRWA